MVENKTFLENPNHQYRVTQCGNHDYGAHSKKNVDYYEYPCLTHFIDEH